MCQFDSSFYCSAGNTTSNDSWVFNSSTSEWNKSETTTSPTISQLNRYASAAVATEDGVYIFGGFFINGNQSEATNELLHLDLASGEWSLVGEGTTGPPAQGFAAAILINDTIYIVPGCRTNSFVSFTGSCDNNAGEMWGMFVSPLHILQYLFDCLFFLCLAPDFFGVQL